MRKKLVIIIAFALFAAAGLAGSLLGPSMAEAHSEIWNSCPRGQTDCTYPGECRSYIDTNNDGICDRSQPNPELADPAEEADDNNAPLIATAVDEGKTRRRGGAAAIPEVTPQESTAQISEVNNSYYLLPVLFAVIALYTLTWLLSARSRISVKLHRKIWNVVLLVAAAASALLGLVLIMNIDFDTAITLPFDMLFWHVETGIVLGAIAAFHIFWHWRYFVKMLRMRSQ